MASVKGTMTEKNLLASFAGESQARNRYTFFSSVAKKEGYEKIAAIFLETAGNEQQHAKQFFKQLEGGEVEITASYPAGVIGTTAENLKAAAEGENMEHTVIYPDAAKVADEEGFPQIATLFRLVGSVEVDHENRYRHLLKQIEEGSVHKRDAPTKWICRKCGYIHDGPEAPQVCPLCSHPQSYFEEKIVDY